MGMRKSGIVFFRRLALACTKRWGMLPSRRGSVVHCSRFGAAEDGAEGEYDIFGAVLGTVSRSSPTAPPSSLLPCTLQIDCPFSGTKS